MNYIIIHLSLPHSTISQLSMCILRSIVATFALVSTKTSTGLSLIIAKWHLKLSDTLNISFSYLCVNDAATVVDCWLLIVAFVLHTTLMLLPLGSNHVYQNSNATLIPSYVQHVYHFLCKLIQLIVMIKIFWSVTCHLQLCTTKAHFHATQRWWMSTHCESTLTLII